MTPIQNRGHSKGALANFSRTVATISPEDAAKPLEASERPLVKKQDRGQGEHPHRQGAGTRRVSKDGDASGLVVRGDARSVSSP
jgi:hypothetical protein